ncbi:MAG: glycosyltransferase [Clostridiales Family XIII bacterium]|jgi:glycosyltransferase involved in cell wall biosynthesis|nr:glycosyltransferase [Clostridiales Family XIII bacterium]
MISIIIPVYNAEAYLRECVSSILGQTYRDIEVILVDDGSLDGSPALCDALAKEDKRIVVIHKENGGVSSARNAGLDMAKGDYITFADCDDFIKDSSMYEELLALAKDRSSDITISTFFEELPDGNVRYSDSGEILCLTGEEATAALLGNTKDKTIYGKFVWFFVWNKLYRAEILKDIRFDTLTNSAEDVPINLAAFAKTDNIVYIEKPYYFWRHRNESQSRDRSVSEIRSGALTGKIMYDYAIRLPSKYKSAAVQTAYRNIYWYYSFCTSEIRRLRRLPIGNKTKDLAEFIAARDEMRSQMKDMKKQADYKYLSSSFKLAVILMTDFPEIFAFIWAIYHKIKGKN